MHWLLHLLSSGVSVYIVAKLLPGIQAKSLWSAIAFAFVAGVLNAILWTVFRHGSHPHPFEPFMLGAGGVILNGIVFLVAARIVKGIKVSGCIMALIGSFAVTFLNGLIYAYVSKLVR
jgi:putative membrane protein